MSDAAAPFPALLRAAILGTDRAAPEVSTGDAAIDAALGARPGEPAERTLLRAAAAFAVVERTGIPATTIDTGALVPVDDARPRCGPLAASDLRAILDGNAAEADAASASDLFAEWCDLADRFARRAPEELLPALLARGAQATHLRAASHGILDARGRWLAAQNPRWSYAIAADDDARAFETGGSLAARAAALRRLRRTDAGAARALLEATWPAEQPADRAALLAGLGPAIGPDDEPFLERALDDKRRDVRAVAAEALYGFAESAAARRAIALATPLVRLERAPPRAPRLHVALPEALTPEMRRDGIETKPDRAGIGERAWWLERLLAAVPPAHWMRTFGTTAGDLVVLARESEFAEAAVRGFATAIRRYRDGPALAALLAAATHEPALFEAYRAADHDALATAAREPAVRDALRHRRDGADAILTALRAPWSLELSREALAYARGSVDGDGDWHAFRRRSDLFRTIAARLDPRTPGVRAGWPDAYASERVRTLVETTLAAFEFRAAMLEHFEDDA